MDTFSMYMEKHEVHVKIGDLKHTNLKVSLNRSCGLKLIWHFMS